MIYWTWRLALNYQQSRHYSLFLLSVAGLMGQYCFAGVCRRRRLLSSVMLPAGGLAGRMDGWRAGHRARGQSGCQHCTVGQYGYIPLGRHLVFYAFATNSVGEGIMLSRCPSVVCSSGQILQLDQSRWTFQGIFTSPYCTEWLDSGGQRWRLQQTVEVKYFELHISWTTWAVLMKLTGNNH